MSWYRMICVKQKTAVISNYRNTRFLKPNSRINRNHRRCFQREKNKIFSNRNNWPNIRLVKPNIRDNRLFFLFFLGEKNKILNNRNNRLTIRLIGEYPK